MQRFIRLPTATEIWDAVARTFYDGSDETRIFELNQKSFSTKQNGRPLPTYYNELLSIFQEIDHRTQSQATTVDGVVENHSAMARLRVHIFLSGLDPVFDQVRGEILRKEPKLGLEHAYAAVRREHSQQQVMEANHRGGPPGFPENAVMMTRHHQPAGANGRERSWGAAEIGRAHV